MTSKYVKDILPSPLKDRSQLGVVDLTLEEGTQVKVFGVVYGLEHEVRGDGFSAKLVLDHYSQRIKVITYEGPNVEALMEKLQWLAEVNQFDKIIVMATRQDWQRFLRRGYVMEAVLKYFHQGEDAFVMGKFGSQDRITSNVFFEELQLIEKILKNDPPLESSIPPEGFEFRLAKRDDIPALIALYQKIFETYPSPLIHADYLETVFQKENLFAVATWDGKIVSAASAELNPQERAAELTDCATLPDHRGKSLMSHILLKLEQELQKRDYICAYTMARARSFGMNNVFYQLHYEFTGRLVNNCDIYGAYEDMNIWVKSLKNPHDSPYIEKTTS